jgi:hypothetical protein
VKKLLYVVICFVVSGCFVKTSNLISYSTINGKAKSGVIKYTPENILIAREEAKTFCGGKFTIINKETVKEKYKEWVQDCRWIYPQLCRWVLWEKEITYIVEYFVCN